jgi:hypothetical protein
VTKTKKVIRIASEYTESEESDSNSAEESDRTFSL